MGTDRRKRRRRITGSVSGSVLLAGILCAAAVFSVQAGDELVLARDGRSEYQVVVPAGEPSPLVGQLLRQTGELVQLAFSANGVELPVVREGEHDPGRPGIYLGDTAFARAHGFDPAAVEAWGYVVKAAGRDLVIAGRDQPMPGSDRPEKWPPHLLRWMGARVGTAKGVADFLHRHAGARFLCPRGANGIEFLPTPTISVPAALDATVQPRLRSFFAYQYGMVGARTLSPDGNDLFMIANNYLPNTDFVFAPHTYERAIATLANPAEHLDHFALIGGKRTPGTHLCIANPAVQELIYQDMLDFLDLGYDATLLGQQDGFQACQCAACRDLFETGDDWSEKLWCLHRRLAERLLVDRPGKTVIALSYGHTWAPPKTFKAFPANTSVMLCRMTDDLVKQWAECTVPRGYVGYLYLFGTYGPAGYTPKSTPRAVERLARQCRELGLTALHMDGFGQSFGLEGPTCYVFGRMFDDPVPGLQDVLAEYYDAAFREAMPPMRRFFDTLHRAVQFYVDRPGSTPDIDGRPPPAPRRDDALRLIGYIYSPDVLAELEMHLTHAERLAESAKVKARLALVRLEFGYLRHIAHVAHLWDAYRDAPGPGTHGPLLDAVDAWNRFLGTLYPLAEATGLPTGDMRRGPIPQWPEHQPFLDHPHWTVGLVRNELGRTYEHTPLNWDTAARRKAGAAAVEPAAAR